MKNKEYIKHLRLVAASIPLFILSACMDEFLPEVQESFDRDANFTQHEYKPILGRISFFSDNFAPGNSTTQPLTFEITRIVRADGSPAPELTDVFPVRVWKQPYLGTETTLKEIEEKRGIEYRPLFQVRKHSGEFVMWANATSAFINCAPSKGYLFDVKAENKGGYRYYNNLKLLPLRENDFEPAIYDSETGMLIDKDYITATLAKAVTLEGGSMTFADNIRVYLRENTENTASPKTLTFRFYNSDYTPIAPEKFNLTRWDELVHGFNCRIGEDRVTYDVAYPVPLTHMMTKYTNTKGDMVKLRFSYDRINVFGIRISSFFEVEFAIYKEGHWEVMVVFADGSPEFRDYQ